MLAESQSRRKQKLSTNPNGHMFSDDPGNIGKKLLTQMGWEKGKGLGLNEQGEKDPIKVHMNRESRGLGFKRADGNKWIEHQDDFNSLLAELNEASASDQVSAAPVSEQEVAKSSVQSLEAKSKSSRSRVHYMKFTKGKDLSRHSDKDLACILGPGLLSSNSPSSENVSAVNSDDSQASRPDPFLSDTLHVTSTLSLHEYFAAKMASKKSNGSTSSLGGLVTATPSPDSTAEDDNETVTAVRPSFFIGDAEEDSETVDREKSTHKSKKKKNKEKDVEIALEDEAAEISTKKKHKEKKKKKDKQYTEGEEETQRSGGKTKPKPADDTMKFVSESSDEGEVNTTTKESCKKKSKKRKYCEENLLPADATADGEANAKKQMRKSRSDSFLLELEQSNELVEDCDDNEYKKKKKKSKKRKSKEL
ncbi:PINX1 [Bugula neritina]|uniref:PINX1 n=1 Tax=Bugula neritina TaxID=10212 RepID=A0A7J7JFK4_BUGNE|nr:PINX1 [Bugula neritina]